MRKALGTLLFLLALEAPASAAPMFTDFPVIQREASTVVVGTVHQAVAGNVVTVTVDVDKVIRGTANSGPMVVKQSPDGSIGIDNERVVAFIDGNGALRWVGKKIAGSNIETGVLQLEGFFDFNAHIVHPGILTLDQLKTLLSTNKLDQTFDVTMTFPDGKGGFKPSQSHFTVQYDAMTRTLSSIQGLAPTCLGPPSMSSMDWGRFSLSFYDTCQKASSSKSRSLSIEGTFTGVTATGAIQVNAIPDRPFLYEPEWNTFVSDGTQLDVTRMLKITLSDGSVWTWRVGQDLVDPSGSVHASGGISMSSSMKNNVTTSQDTYDFAGGVKITLSPGAHSGSPGGHPQSLVTLVESGTIGTCTFAQGQTTRTCTLRQSAPIVTKR